MIIISKNSYVKRDYDYEEDDYDRLKNLSRINNKYKYYTNKASMKKIEYDYEEDPYEPEKV